jgi:hypothetical protein
MVTKKRTKKATKKSTAAKKRSSAAKPKKAAARRPKKAATRSGSARKATAKKTAPKKKSRAPAPKRASKSRKPLRREDRPGHLDPHYAAELRAQSGPPEEDPRPFIDSARSPGDDLAEERGEEVVEKATTGEDEAEELLDQVVPEEQGGPFVETNAAQEFAHGTDPSNPRGAKREPFPTT